MYTSWVKLTRHEREKESEHALYERVGSQMNKLTRELNRFRLTCRIFNEARGLRTRFPSAKTRRKYRRSRNTCLYTLTTLLNVILSVHRKTLRLSYTIAWAKTSPRSQRINNESANDVVALTWLLTLKVVHVRCLRRDSQYATRRNKRPGCWRAQLSSYKGERAGNIPISKPIAGKQDKDSGHRSLSRITRCQSSLFCRYFLRTAEAERSTSLQNTFANYRLICVYFNLCIHLFTCARDLFRFSFSLSLHFEIAIFARTWVISVC